MKGAALFFVVFPLASASATDIEVRQNEARRQIARHFTRLASQVPAFAEQAAAYDEACGGLEPPRSCRTRLVTLRRRAIDLRTQIDAAEDAGRQGWLIPGEVNEVRRRSINDDSWDAAVRLVECWRNAEPPLGTLSTQPPGRGGSRRRR